MRLSSGLISLLIGFALSGPSLAVDPAGSAVAVNPQATGALAGARAVTLASGDDVFLGQTVVTGNEGEVQIVFSDNTHLVVGPGANLVIAEYLMRNDTSASNITINALGGTFRFLTGNSPKNAYTINTPTGTMGVRGTAFDFTVIPNGLPNAGETSIILYHGAVRFCGVDKCKTLSNLCDIGLLSTADATSIVRHTDRKRMPLLPGFPYLESQGGLREDFQLDGLRDCQKVKINSVFSSVVGKDGGSSPPPDDGEGEGEGEGGGHWHPPPPPPWWGGDDDDDDECDYSCSE